MQCSFVRVVQIYRAIFIQTCNAGLDQLGHLDADIFKVLFAFGEIRDDLLRLRDLLLGLPRLHLLRDGVDRLQPSINQLLNVTRIELLLLGGVLLLLRVAADEFREDSSGLTPWLLSNSGKNLLGSLLSACCQANNLSTAWCG